jgi:hypothetical protein
MIPFLFIIETLQHKNPKSKITFDLRPFGSGNPAIYFFLLTAPTLFGLRREAR